MSLKKYTNVYYFLDKDEEDGTETLTACFPQSVDIPTRIPERALCGYLTPSGDLAFIWINIHEILDAEESDPLELGDYLEETNPHLVHINQNETGEILHP